MKRAREDAATRQWIQRELNYIALHDSRLFDDGNWTRSPKGRSGAVDTRASEATVSPSSDA